MGMRFECYNSLIYGLNYFFYLTTQTLKALRNLKKNMWLTLAKKIQREFSQVKI